jgi:hypothetical protein
MEETACVVKFEGQPPFVLIARLGRLQRQVRRCFLRGLVRPLS